MGRELISGEHTIEDLIIAKTVSLQARIDELEQELRGRGDAGIE